LPGGDRALHHQIHELTAAAHEREERMSAAPACQRVLNEQNLIQLTALAVFLPASQLSERLSKHNHKLGNNSPKLHVETHG